MAQYARPSSTVSAGSWSASGAATLHGALNETSPSDNEYVAAGSVTACTMTLGAVDDPEVGTGHVLSYRLRRSATNRAKTIVVRLMEGSTERASWEHVNPSGTFTTFNQTLTSTQANAITSYSSLRLILDLTSSGHVQGTVEVSWAQLEVPENPDRTASLAVTEQDDTLSGSATFTLDPFYAIFRRTPPTHVRFDPMVDAWIGTTASSPYVDQGLDEATYEYQVYYWSGSAWSVGSALDTAEVTDSSPDRTATLNVTEDSDVLAASATYTPATITGSLAVTEAGDSLAASATHTPPVFSATLAVTEAGDSLAAAATHTPPVFSASLDVTEDGDVLAAAAEHTPPLFEAALAVTEDSDTLAASATYEDPDNDVTASLNVTEQSDVLAASATHSPPVFEGSVAAVEDSDVLAASATHEPPVFSATLANVEDDDTLAAEGTVTSESEYAALITLREPVAYWRLGETTGTVAYDETGNHDATLPVYRTLGESPLIYGDSDPALATEWVDGVALPSSTPVPGSGSFAIELWYSKRYAGTAGLVGIGGKREEEGYPSLTVWCNSSGTLFTEVRDASDMTTVSASSPSPISLNTTYHIVAVLDRGDDLLKLYINSQLVASADISSLGAVSPTDYANFFIGLNKYWTGSSYSTLVDESVFDEVALYDYALTLAEVQQSWSIGSTHRFMSVDAVEQDDVLAASASHTPPVFTGSLASTEAADTLAASASHVPPVFTATLGITEAGDTLASTATHTPPVFEATLSATEDADVLSASATYTPGTLSGTLDVTEQGDTLAATAFFTTEGISGYLAATEDDDVLDASASYSPPLFSATLAVTEASDTLSAAATFTPLVTSTLNVTEDPDTLAAAASHEPPVFTAELAVTEQGDTLAASASFVTTAALALTEQDDVLAASAVYTPGGIAGALDVVEGNDHMHAHILFTPKGDPDEWAGPGRMFRGVANRGRVRRSRSFWR